MVAGKQQKAAKRKTPPLLHTLWLFQVESHRPIFWCQPVGGVCIYHKLNQHGYSLVNESVIPPSIKTFRRAYSVLSPCKAPAPSLKYSVQKYVKYLKAEKAYIQSSKDDPLEPMPNTHPPPTHDPIAHQSKSHNRTNYEGRKEPLCD